MPPRTPHSPSGNAGASFPARPVSRPGGDRSASFSSHDADWHPSATGAATFYADYLSSCEREGTTPLPRADWAGIPAAEKQGQDRLGAALVTKLAAEEPIILPMLRQPFGESAPIPSKGSLWRTSLGIDWPLSLEMEERMREEEMTSANPLAVAAILVFASIVAFASGFIVGRQLLAAVL